MKIISVGRAGLTLPSKIEPIDSVCLEMPNGNYIEIVQAVDYERHESHSVGVPENQIVEIDGVQRLWQRIFLL